MSLEAQLREGAAALGLPLGEPVHRKLLDYLALLAKWNRVYNLTAVREESAMVAQHLLDSLAVLPHLPQGRLADVGSGGGLPGIPLAIAQPRREVVLIESNHKKAAFLEQARIELALGNLSVVNERVEACVPAEPFAVVISRAFSDLAEFARLAAHLLAPQGVLAAMKGVYPHEELAQLPPGVRLDRVVALRVPGLDAGRHLVFLRRD
jgi:16S rRNA (guanine527-N7)-methyltransferase